MTAEPVPLLSRATAGRPTAPVGAVHLGLGNFFRAHQAAYTEQATDAEDWGFAAFTGRHPARADQMSAQDGLYTLVEQTEDGNTYAVVSSVSRAYPGERVESWVDLVSRPSTRLLTLTVTEAAYLRTEAGDADLDDPALAADLVALERRDLTSVRSVPGRLVAGLAARYALDGAPLAVLPCDNLLHNGAAVRRVVTGVSDRLDAGLASWVRDSVSFVDSVVDRITPRSTEADRRDVRHATGLLDTCPVVTEPFSEWVLSGSFPAGRPDWEAAGALVVDDVTAFEQRKIWMLNGAHSLLAYGGSIRGHSTVAEAVSDDTCIAWVDQWWDEAACHLDLESSIIADYRAALRERFANRGMRHLLGQIAADGSQKLPVRVLPVVGAEREAGRMPVGGARTLGAWVLHLRGRGAAVDDPAADDLVPRAAGSLREAVRRVLDALDEHLATDDELVDVVVELAEELLRT